MEIIICEIHGSACLLKTGVKDGPSKGKSFYVCTARDSTPCNFALPTEIPPSHCLQHEDSMVELQTLTYNDKQDKHKLFYRCAVGKTQGQKWCGCVPWKEKDPERKTNIYDKNQPSILPPVRNPFKLTNKLDKPQCKADPDKAMHKEEVKRDNTHVNIEDHAKTENEGGNAKSTETERRIEGQGGLNGEGGNGAVSDSWRSKKLPAGMKIRKRVSDDERHGESAEDTKCPESPNGAEESTSVQKLAEKASESCSIKGQKGMKSTATGSSSQSASKSSCGLDKKTAVENEAEEDVIPNKQSSDKTQSKSKPTPSSTLQDLPNSEKPTYNDQKTEPNHSQEKGHKGVVSSQFGEWSDDDDVQVVSVHPAPQQSTRTPTAPVQKTLTSYIGFQPASKVKGQSEDPVAIHSHLTAQLKQKKSTLSVVNVSALPDKGERLKSQVKELEDALESLSLTTASLSGETEFISLRQVSHSSHKCFALRATMNPKELYCQVCLHIQGGLWLCVYLLHEIPTRRCLEVELMPHQRRALAWLLWRETQKPCGGILADDMGLGKTLTMIALILSQKKKDEKVEEWISKNDSTLVASQGTLIICPASLVHHWKIEIEKRVKSNRLSVYLYHGPNRQRSASVLAEHDVVITTYSLVSKEIPVRKEDAEKPSQDSDRVTSDMPPLLRVAWARMILDEAHNIKNPKVQTSMAVCKLRAKSRWAVTGTPIQNNLLDMYSLLKFLRCSPFDEYKLWKAQVDNGSKRGGERLNILTRTLLLRRTKTQMDSSGKPLVCLPDRTCEVHRLKLSEDEQAVYDVVFAQSRSTLQNYLKRHEGGETKKGDHSNPFEKVAREFGMSQQDTLSSSQQNQASSTIHILSLLLRLRQCCCHLSLLKKTLDQSEMQGDGVTLSLEEQLCALSLAESADSDQKDMVSLNGSRFRSEVFQESRESTKISAILTELRVIRKKDHKSVIVSQWTSMLQIVAGHLKKMDLKFAVIDGTVNPKRRMDLVEEFNTNPKGPQVMLVSLCAGGVGLNLIGGNHLFLMDMHWNPALEDQACDRIYRVGQHRDVTIHRFVCEGTVEDKISSLQEKKKELAQKVLSGTGSSFTKLSLADLRVIFGV
ncbi:Transcription termination factor 2 [Triplophysa tibetana]|uniref:Transcription termination factor 2 n=1 Tax=Triplophysa tibetana TaxID=1572043 RepID=A0A5A9NZW2_9TELE|nr:Transcription termination factor 2 [Triplophysa tibetana]